MITAFLRLFALRRLLSLAVFGIPVLILIAVGLLTVMVLKLLVFVVLPIALIVWVARKMFWPAGD